MVGIVLNFTEQFIIPLLHQLIKFWQVRLAEAASLALLQKCMSTLAVSMLMVMRMSAAPRRLRGRQLQAGLCHPMMSQYTERI